MGEHVGRGVAEDLQAVGVAGCQQAQRVGAVVDRRRQVDPPPVEVGRDRRAGQPSPCRLEA